MTTTDAAYAAPPTSTFPVQWQRPEHELTSWAQGRMASPEPIPAAAGLFESLLRASQSATVVSEDHGDLIDFRYGYRLWQALIELGRRLAGVA
jgi:hypothetical protein